MTANPTEPLDAAFRLLDRQIIDCAGSLVAKVDDLELAELPDGRLAVTALLVGPGALGPRLGGRVGTWWVALWRRLHPDRDPAVGRIPITDITRIDSAIRIGRTRADLGLEGFEDWVYAHVVSRLPGAGVGGGGGEPGGPERGEAPATPAPEVVTRRLVGLLGLRVLGPDGAELGYVNDARVSLPVPSPARAPVVGLIVDNRPRGTLLGYERRPRQGPWLVRILVRAVHRTAGYAPWQAVQNVHWSAGTVTLRAPGLQDL